VKVLHVITGLAVGGAELQLRSILNHTRHEADVVTLYNPGAVAEMIRSDGTRVRDLGMRSNTELSALLRLRTLIAEGGYDVVHTHLYRSCIYGRPAARLAGAPIVVTTEHSIGETHLERRKMTAGVRALYLGTDLCSNATIAVSGAVRERLVAWGVPARKITVIPNGLDLDRIGFDSQARERVRTELGIPAGARVVGVLGRLEANKQFEKVITAAAPLLDESTRVMVVGDGTERERLEKTAAAAGVTGRVVFAGERHDVAAVLSALDVFVASSKQETFGLSVLEAMAGGLPALYTTCPALDDVDTDRARRIPDEEEGMRAAIAAELVADRRQTTGDPEVARRYGIDAVTDRIDGLYETLAARRRGPAAVPITTPLEAER
jgi:glycosyltransferase involved in cell wall biosynthesis